MKWSSFQYLVKQGWHSMVANRLMTLASVGVLTACLVITGVAALLSLNVNAFVSYLGGQNMAEFYINDAADPTAVSALLEQVQVMEHVTECEYISKAKAVEEMMGWWDDYSDLLSDYAGEDNPGNPLPASLRVQISDPAALPQTVERIKQLGQANNLFYTITSPSELSNVLVNLKRVVNIVGWGLVAVLGVVSVVVISNTIRLTVFARRKEINIMKFVGATNAFIRLPFFVEGMTVGAIAGALATAVVSGGYYALLEWLQQPSAAWLSDFAHCVYTFQQVWPPLLISFVLFGIWIGGTGCASSIRKHLKV